jgi:glycosyltransferase involved in cell wall biosynthesis
MSKHVLMVHNYYQSHAPSGEDIAFNEDENLLRIKGNKITLYTRHNDELKTNFTKKIPLMWQTSWSRKSYKAIKELIKSNNPDIAHIHNTFPLISPSIYFACHECGIPVVQTIHNYRLFCAAGTFFRKNNICNECLEHNWIQAIKYGCYRSSRLQTIPVVCMQQLHKYINTWNKHVDIYIALTDFSRQKLIQCGLSTERVAVKPNFFLSAPEPCYENNGYGVFLGRLSVEKGLLTLLSAWKNLYGIPLKIIGDGALRGETETAIKNMNDPAIQFIGFQPHEKCLELLKYAKFMVMPSEWYEGFPMTIREAFACGKPVIASRIGAMAEIITEGKTGLLFEPGNPNDLANKVQWLMEHEENAIQMGKNARKEFEMKYTADKNYEILMKIYETAIITHNKENVRKK